MCHCVAYVRVHTCITDVQTCVRVYARAGVRGMRGRGVGGGGGGGGGGWGGGGVGGGGGGVGGGGIEGVACTLVHIVIISYAANAIKAAGINRTRVTHMMHNTKQPYPPTFHTFSYCKFVIT